LLEAHRALCEAAILLAATGAPSAALPRSPDVIVVCPLEHAAATEIPAALRDAGFVPLVVGEDFAQLPHLVRLLGPRAVVGVPGTSATADAALQRSRMVARELRFVALRVAGAAMLELADTTCVDDLGAVVESLSGITPLAARGNEAASAIDLEVVSI
jgi:hypothetical protein